MVQTACIMLPFVRRTVAGISEKLKVIRPLEKYSIRKATCLYGQRRLGKLPMKIGKISRFFILILNWMILLLCPIIYTAFYVWINLAKQIGRSINSVPKAKILHLFCGDSKRLLQNIQL